MMSNNFGISFTYQKEQTQSYSIDPISENPQNWAKTPIAFSTHKNQSSTKTPISLNYSDSKSNNYNKSKSSSSNKKPKKYFNRFIA